MTALTLYLPGRELANDSMRVCTDPLHQAKIYWDKGNYTMVEKIFRKSVEFCNEHDSWKLNVAHVLFMQVL